MAIVRIIPAGTLTLGGSKITIPTYVMSPGTNPPVHHWVSYLGASTWFVCFGYGMKRAQDRVKTESFEAALKLLPTKGRVVLGVTDGILNSEGTAPTVAPVDPPVVETVEDRIDPVEDHIDLVEDHIDLVEITEKDVISDTVEIEEDLVEIKEEPKVEVSVDFDPEEGDQLLIFVGEKSFDGVVDSEDSRTMEVSWDGKSATFTKRSNGSWVKKGSKTDGGIWAALIQA